MTEKGCDNCYYTYFDERAYPCSLCIRGIERTDKWQPNRKTKEGSHDKALECIATMIKARNKAQTEDFFREPTAEERKAVADYIESISIPTGVNVFDFMDEPKTETEAD